MGLIISAGVSLFFWIFLVALTAVIAERKGRKGFGYCLISIFFTPLVGLVIVAAVSDKNKRECPLCCKMIDIRARVCAYCGRDVRNNSVNNKRQAESAESGTENEK